MRSGLRRAVTANVVAMLLVVFGTALPSGVASSALPKSQVELCSVMFNVTSLRISRGTPMNREKFTFPRLVFVRKALSAQSVATALCALPTMPSGPISCPFDDGFSYSLLFSAPGASVTDVRFDPTGCGQVYGLGAAVRWTEESPGIYRTLGDAMKLKNASESTFGGALVQ